MRNRHLYLLAAALILLGGGLFAAKATLLDLPLTPEAVHETWQVEARIAFNGRNRPTKVRLALPQQTGGFTLIDQGFVSQGYGLSTRTEDGQRLAVLATRRAKGRQVLYYRFTVDGRGVHTPRPASQPAVARPDWSPARETAARAVLDKARQESADILTLAANLLGPLAAPQADGNAAFLLGPAPGMAERARVAAGILAHANIAARPVHGLALEGPQRDAEPHTWLEVWANGQWHPMPLDPARTEVPDDHLAWWRGDMPLVRVEGAKAPEVAISVTPVQRRALPAALAAARAEGDGGLLAVSLFGLPLDVQQVYRVLMVVPLGALLLVVLRNVIGISTFGTFMPVLIALAFRETQLLWGLVLFVGVVGLALAVRLYFEHLKLLVVPRLAAVLIIVVAAMALLSLLSHKLGLERGLSIALFPMVILTMTVERMSVVWDERGAGESIRHGLGSLAVASLCYGVMANAYAEHLMFVFPELLLVLLALILLLGRYTGYRLTELRRFRVLAREDGG